MVELDDEDLIIVEVLPTPAPRRASPSWPRGVRADESEDDAAAYLESIAVATSRARVSSFPRLSALAPLRPVATEQASEAPPPASELRLRTIPPPPLEAEPELVPVDVDIEEVEIEEVEIEDVELEEAEVVPVSSRLPAVTAPPYPRLNPWPRASSPDRSEVETASRPWSVAGVSAPRSPFVRRTASSPDLREPKLTPVPNDAAGSGSMAPVSLPARGEPTVIVVRERPRAEWMMGSAAIGAFCAVAVMAVIARWAAPSAPAPVAATAPASPPPAAVAAEAAEPASAAAPVTTAATSKKGVVQFGEGQGLAIRSGPAPRARSWKPAARPSATHAQSTPPPATMPDGSLGLASKSNASTATTSAASTSAPSTPVAQAQPSAAPLPQAQEPAPGNAPGNVTAKSKRPLTPEQELAEAQLRASLR